MRQVIQIPDGLNKKESALYRSLMRSSEKNIEKRWVYNNVKNIIGHKTTNPMNGEVEITFSYSPILPKEAFKNEKSSISMVTKELEQIKNSLDLKIEGMKKQAEDLELKSNKIDEALTTLKEMSERK